MRLLPLGMLAAGILCGCSDSDAPMPDAEAQADGAITVVLRVPTDGADIISRADPMPGEDGNGREQGILNENEIHDVNILFYVGDGLNPANSTVALSGVYISDMSSAQVSAEELPFEKVYTIKVSPSELSSGSSEILSGASAVSFITVANAGRDLSAEFASLDALRRYCFDRSWTAGVLGSRSAADCDRFIMTTAYDTDLDGIVTIDGTSRSVGSSRLKKTDSPASADSPEWHGETTVQRICARIDLMYPQGAIAGSSDGAISGLNYKVADTENTVHLTNALPVNVMQRPSYLLTRVTDAVPSAWTEAGLGAITWGGIEKSAGSPAAPANYVIDPYTLLKESEVADADIASWYGDTRAAAAVIDIANSLSKGRMSDYYSGVLPVPETRYGCTHHTIIGYANENIQSPLQFSPQYITGIVFRAVYQPRIWVRRSADSYVSESVSDAEWAAMADRSFTRYMPTAEGAATVTDSRAMYFANHADALSYADAHPEDRAILTRFANGVCYYNLWLRHYNDEAADPQQTYPMEYAIVRNNIYRVALTFSGVGNPTADLRAPDTMMARIFVRKWNLRKETQPLEF